MLEPLTITLLLFGWSETSLEQLCDLTHTCSDQRAFEQHKESSGLWGCSKVQLAWSD